MVRGDDQSAFLLLETEKEWIQDNQTALNAQPRDYLLSHAFCGLNVPKYDNYGSFTVTYFVQC